MPIKPGHPPSEVYIASHPDLEAWQRKLNLPVLSSAKTSVKSVTPYLWLDLVPIKNQPYPALALCSAQSGPVFIDFIGGKKAHRQQFGGGKKQPLARAIGHTANRLHQAAKSPADSLPAALPGLPNVVDATAGMGGDSFVLASLGYSVQMLERSAIVSALLDDALSRAQHQMPNLPASTQAAMQRLSLLHANASDYLLSSPPQVDVVYLDPMYPHKKKTAAVKKEMRCLQQLVGPDLDSEALLTAALQAADTRVVVKRPKGAKPLANQHNLLPSTHISSPNTRYDIYVIKALESF